jgi:hypothetical protein
LEAHVLAYGVPLGFYSDRHGIFRVNAKEAQGGDGITEFGRVVKRLRIELIHAATLQAKGRVERANQTLQDRLIKEMRLAGVRMRPYGGHFTFIQGIRRKFLTCVRRTIIVSLCGAVCPHMPSLGVSSLDLKAAERRPPFRSKLEPGRIRVVVHFLAGVPPQLHDEFAA